MHASLMAIYLDGNVVGIFGGILYVAVAVVQEMRNEQNGMIHLCEHSTLQVAVRGSRL